MGVKVREKTKDSGVWWVFVAHNGKRTSRKVGDKEAAEEVARETAVEILDSAREIFATLRTRDAYPRHSGRKTRQFLRFWFDSYARRQLASLSIAIGGVRNNITRDALWCGFSRLIICKQSGASLAMDLSHSRPHKSFDRAPAEPFRKFLTTVDRVLDNCIDRNTSGRGPAPYIQEGTALDLPLKDGSVDLVLTSPPYLNAIDYIRCSKFSLVWMGYSIAELSRLRTDSVGSEAGWAGAQDDQEINDIIENLNLRPQLRVKDEAMLVRYINDMRQAVCEVARVLAPGGRAVYVVGENTIRGTYIRNSAMVSAVAELSGLRLDTRCVRMLPANRRYLPPPSVSHDSGALNTRMRREVVLAFTKPAV